MELFRSGACFGRAGVFRGLCERDCFCQSFWNVAIGGCSADTGRMVCVGMQEIQGIVLIWKLAWTFETFGVQQVASCRQCEYWGGKDYWKSQISVSPGAVHPAGRR